MNRSRPFAPVICLALAFLLLDATAGAHASSPFGIATPDSNSAGFSGPLGPFFVWVALRQAAFYTALMGWKQRT